MHVSPRLIAMTQYGACREFDRLARLAGRGRNCHRVPRQDSAVEVLVFAWTMVVDLVDSASTDRTSTAQSGLNRAPGRNIMSLNRHRT